MTLSFLLLYIPAFQAIYMAFLSYKFTKNFSNFQIIRMLFSFEQSELNTSKITYFNNNSANYSVTYIVKYSDSCY